jgi:hypothetical protein
MPKIKDEKRYKLSDLAREVEATRSSKLGEPAAFDWFLFQNVLSVLESCLEFDPEIPQVDRSKLIKDAVLDAANIGTVDDKSLMRSLWQFENKYTNTPLQDYILATSISYAYFPQLTHLNVDGSTITFSRHLPKHFNRSNILDDLDRVAAMEDLDRMASVRIRVKARTHNAAMDRALNSLDFIRSLWNYGIHWRTRMRHQGGLQEPKPINHVVAGPVHTLHLPNGSLATERFWYEPQYLQQKKLYSLKSRWSDAHKSEREARARLKKLVYAQDVKELFVRYVRALDNVDHEVAFNKLWAVFETLADSIGKYEEVIKRCLFVVKVEERDFLRLILEHLRDVRNGSVHYAKTRDPMMTYIYQLKWFVEQLFSFHLSHGTMFKSIEKAGKFLALPTIVEDIEGQIAYHEEQLANYRKALRYQTR